MRGAYAALSVLPDNTDVITASAGNFGQGLAFGASQLGRVARIVVPRGTPEIKIQRITRFGGRVEVCGNDFDEAYAVARRLSTDCGLPFIPPFDDPHVIEGQGTAALELMAEVPRLDALVVPCGGGGLAAGVALYAKAVRSNIRVVAVEPAVLPSLGAALRAGTPVRMPPGKSLADGIAVRQIGALPLRVLRRLLDGVVTVTEEELGSAFRFLALETKQVVEGAGVAAVAAVRRRLPILEGCRHVGVFVTGGNIDPARMATLFLDLSQNCHA